MPINSGEEVFIRHRRQAKAAEPRSTQPFILRLPYTVLQDILKMVMVPSFHRVHPALIIDRTSPCAEIFYLCYVCKVFKEHVEVLIKSHFGICGILRDPTYGYCTLFDLKLARESFFDQIYTQEPRDAICMQTCAMIDKFLDSMVAYRLSAKRADEPPLDREVEYADIIGRLQTRTNQYWFAIALLKYHQDIIQSSVATMIPKYSKWAPEYNRSLTWNIVERMSMDAENTRAISTNQVAVVATAIGQFELARALLFNSTLDGTSDLHLMPLIEAAESHGIEYVWATLNAP